MKLYQEVEAILKADIPINGIGPRDSDKVLMIQVWRRYGLRLDEWQEHMFLKMPIAESIRRDRQKLQEKGLYPANPSVKKQRELKAMVIQQTVPTASGKRLDEVQGQLINLEPIRRYY